MRGVKKSWKAWKESDPTDYNAFTHYREAISRKDKIFSQRNVSGIMDIDGEIDEFELEKILDSSTDPIDVDQFMRCTTI